MQDDSMRVPSLHDLRKGRRLGEGSYGVVYEATERESGRHVAVKRSRTNLEPEEVESLREEQLGRDVGSRRQRDDEVSRGVGIPIPVIRETRILTQLKHPNIVQLDRVIPGGPSQAGAFFLVLELALGDLASLLESHKLARRLSIAETKYITNQLLEALEFLHDRWVLHRDVSLSNLLLRKDGTIALADFGLARFVGDPCGRLSPGVVNLWYRAPELLIPDFGTHYSASIDLWAVGCILGELLLGEPLFPGMNEIDQINRIFGGLGVPEDNHWPGMKKRIETMERVGWEIPNKLCEEELVKSRLAIASVSSCGMDLIDQLLLFNPEKRISATAALKHPYLRQEPPLPTPIDTRGISTL
mmetsp:Transcript_5240/g.10700  ORF Transcript_5240/g.10700 Transcript_5240/m.10700 type:complete len:358 (-) Transcript_5240:849-1922(-)